MFFVFARAGGFRATITGTAFSDETVVSFGSGGPTEQCQHVSVSYNQLICDMPPVRVNPFTDSPRTIPINSFKLTL